MLASWDAEKFMTISVPGRVNLIGEHIDYHNLAVLPMAIQRKVSITFGPCRKRQIRAVSNGYPPREFSMDELAAFPPGDWGNYLKAAVQLIAQRWTLTNGIDASVASDLPLAAGLSSSSALMTGIALALLRANEIDPTVRELMELLPEGEQFVGTRGGGMDHAAVLASQTGSALLVQFSPFQFEPIAIPVDWTFIVAHSLTIAEKSGSAKLEYNSRRTAGVNALKELGLPSYRAALDLHCPAQLADLAASLGDPERDAFLHVAGEAERVRLAVKALRDKEIKDFGQLLVASHASLRDRLKVSNGALDKLVDCAMDGGALGARLTGAGFGGCAIILCKMAERENVCSYLIEHFYANRPGFSPADHLLVAEPSSGALFA